MSEQRGCFVTIESDEDWLDRLSYFLSEVGFDIDTKTLEQAFNYANEQMGYRP